MKHGDMCNNQCTGGTKYCPGSHKCGQNLRAVENMNLDPSSAVDSWYSECSRYDHIPTMSDFNDMDVGHYTQVMWKNAKKVGCAISGDVANCLYDQGNIFSSSPELSFEGNVPPPNQCSQRSLKGKGSFDIKN